MRTKAPKKRTFKQQRRAARKATRDIEELTAEISKIDNFIRQGIQQGLEKSGVDLQKRLRREVNSTKTGIKYRGLRNRSSAPGESHANQSGALLRSFGWEVSPKKIEFGWINNPPDHAVIENGTRNMAPRPTLRNLLSNNSRLINRNIQLSIAKNLSKSAFFFAGRTINNTIISALRTRRDFAASPQGRFINAARGAF